MQSKTMRNCVITRNLMPKEEMVRFVISPVGTLVCDFQQKLPGRGYWVTSKRSCIETALKKNVFSKISRQKVEFAPDFIVSLQENIKSRCLSYLHLLKKAGCVVSGFEKVKQAVEKKQWTLLLVAGDAEKSDLRKIQGKAELTIYDYYSNEELGQVFKKDSVVYVAVGSGPLCDKFSQEMKRYQGICFD